MIISVHIPKTGGVTFREVLKSIYKEDIFFHYTPWKKDITLPIIPDNIKIIHGHIPATKYKHSYPEGKFITWLRNPIEIPISMFYYFKRTPDFNNPLCKSLYEDKLSVEEFLLSRKNWNTISNYLSGEKINNFSFIGILE